MPDHMELDERVTDYLDAETIARLEVMAAAAEIMDADDGEVEDGDEIAAVEMG